LSVFIPIPLLKVDKGALEFFSLLILAFNHIDALNLAELKLIKHVADFFSINVIENARNTNGWLRFLEVSEVEYSVVGHFINTLNLLLKL
jgi:hypothetical protein